MKVWPKNEEIRKLLFHPVGGRFREEGPAEWPDDSYTARRIADGDVTVEEQQPAPTEQPTPEPPQQEEASTKKSKK